MADEIAQRWGGVQLGGKLDRELHAAYSLTKAVVPKMVSRGYGRLIHLTTGLSRRPRDGMIALGTAKAALDQFAGSFHRDTAVANRSGQHHTPNLYAAQYTPAHYLARPAVAFRLAAEHGIRRRGRRPTTRSDQCLSCPRAGSRSTGRGSPGAASWRPASPAD
jgi:NAD(P)-dependent dehydrogenase (short-subunit alcohol dehydrogenase family)